MAGVWNWMFEKVPNQYRVRTIKVCLFSGLGERWYNFERLPFGPKVSVTWFHYYPFPDFRYAAHEPCTYTSIRLLKVSERASKLCVGVTPRLCKVHDWYIIGTRDPRRRVQSFCYWSESFEIVRMCNHPTRLIGMLNLELIQTWIWIVMIWKTILKSHSVLNCIKINLLLKENLRKHWPRRDSNPQSSDPKSDAISIRPRGRRS